MMIKKTIIAVVAFAGIAFAPNITTIKAQQPCFLQGSNGQLIDLSHLCGNPTSPPSQETVSPKSGMFKLPIKRRVSGIPVVDVTFNGKYTVEMLFDTGASGITIGTDMASAMGIKAHDSAYSQTAGGMVPIGIGRVYSVKAGELMAKNLEVSINPSLSKIGLLGQNFYGSYDVTIKQNQIELRARS
ncbi:retropepsin-like aspartic protease family protein [Aphanothece sacrum]|uniref:Aspartic protease n=1 Tax=Aphanothece sacrum FPU1 TaxID=1920663 RepID=A0A401IIE1_APHSA|nr:retropepsin-like aspartic protease [Aphanothece sacrum]GBF80940.1 aspartic protease [Aphanothece sacrum FPU1]GBF85247.1 aspartic protease [Aphanothece sacrum FPU3]